ncbi:MULTISPECIES: hypothetical protein [Maribacter]|uniref:Dihydroorotase n=1 Tax=Maribacter flavus TaxID=1658664 RepID=A0A5B2TUC6_9FLAO|nr:MULTISPECIES: hypothetical protein [Maribacter]KAA2217435.1 hypothetical protein F0361_15950 [Maribacter flavus]MDC6405718.1 hypothetical protein [Maribacter sp. PR66]MEE1973030.1 hypothetical protein [Maribacter flavus]
MIKYVFALMFSVSVLNAQVSDEQTRIDVKVGDVFEIGKPETNKYKHIEFPRANFIIKRGGIANYKSVLGEKVVVSSIKEKRNGTTEVRIKKVDGHRFFGSHPSVTVDIDEALNSGELMTK